MRIRGARPDDAEALAAIWNVMIRETLFTFTVEEKSPDGIVAMINDRPDAFWVADAGGLIGFVVWPIPCRTWLCRERRTQHCINKGGAGPRDRARLDDQGF